MHYLQYPTSFTCRYVVENNLLYVEVIDKKVDLVRKRRVIVKEEEKKQILRMCHDGIDGMHFDRDKTYGKVYHCLETYIYHHSRL